MFNLNAVLFSSVITKQIFMCKDCFLQKALEKYLFKEPVKQRVFHFLSIVHKICVGHGIEMTPIDRSRTAHQFHTQEKILYHGKNFRATKSF